MNKEDYNPDLIKLADKYAEATLNANAKAPYDHREYSKQLTLMRAALVLLAGGNGALAYALENAFHDSNESYEHYLFERGYTEAELIEAEGAGYGLEGETLVLTWDSVK
jgi:hypothetical protein